MLLKVEVRLSRSDRSSHLLAPWHQKLADHTLEPAQSMNMTFSCMDNRPPGCCVSDALLGVEDVQMFFGYAEHWPTRNTTHSICSLCKLVSLSSLFAAPSRTNARSSSPILGKSISLPCVLLTQSADSSIRNHD